MSIRNAPGLADVLGFTVSVIPEVRKRGGFTQILKRRAKLRDGLPPL
jgi:hypothetical protein